ncbi:alpha-N-acetylneuraminide alpha-2,8-sialyltransferase isoform X2 [Pyrgilauda ruficollis]|uniref:alpha-N-acetylneuraminide alpha-2,8-sialyltransferase isoform X2 n=1 Tax=Pyrgilauda ruficollis TaxID=221976 RepID=UPI001B877C7D|nr:alpha-N-acetylneuraminide alpha-2,8-sialyltransferase isoform X2 [Pyrgilauda ruficollis]
MWERGPEPRRRCGSRRRMAGLPWKWPRTRLPVGASALGVFVLCWLYVFPVYRLPDEKEIVQGVLLQQGKAWRRNQTAVALFSGRQAGRAPSARQNFFWGGSVGCGEEKGLGAGMEARSRGESRARGEVPRVRRSPAQRDAARWLDIRGTGSARGCEQSPGLPAEPGPCGSGMRRDVCAQPGPWSSGMRRDVCAQPGPWSSGMRRDVCAQPGPWSSGMRRDVCTAWPWGSRMRRDVCAQPGRGAPGCLRWMQGFSADVHPRQSPLQLGRLRAAPWLRVVYYRSHVKRHLFSPLLLTWLGNGDNPRGPFRLPSCTGEGECRDQAATAASRENRPGPCAGQDFLITLL